MSLAGIYALYSSQVPGQFCHPVLVSYKRCDSVQVVQGVEPGPRPVTQQPPSIWAAGFALGLGLAGAVAWRNLTGKRKHNSNREGEWQQTGQQRAAYEDSPTSSIQSLPKTIAKPICLDDDAAPDFPTSLSAVRTAPVDDTSASLEAQAPAVQDRLTEQRRPYTQPATQGAEPVTAPASDQPADYPSPQTVWSSAKDSAPAKVDQSQRPHSDSMVPSDTASRGVEPDEPSAAQAAPSVSQQSAEPSGKQSKAQRSSTCLSDDAEQVDAAAAAASQADASASTQRPRTDSARPLDRQGEAEPSSRGFSDDTEQSDSAADVPLQADGPPSSQPATAESASPERSAETDSGSAESDTESPSGSASELSTAPDADQPGKAGTADRELKQKAESLHDLISESSSRQDDVPDAFQTFDGNLRDEPEPDVTQPGPKLFQSAPKPDTTLPVPQGPQNAQGSPKQDTAAQDLESQPLRPASEAAPAAQESSVPNSSDRSQSSDTSRRVPFAELQPDSVSERSATPSQTDKPADAPVPAATQPGDSAVPSSGAATEENEADAATPAPADSRVSSSQTPGAVTAGVEEQEEEDAAQLRERMEQLRQAMLDQQAALSAAEAASQPPLQQQQQQQQQQAAEQPLKARQQPQQQQQIELAATNKQEDGKSPTVNESKQQQQQQDLADANKPEESMLQSESQPKQQQAGLQQTQPQSARQLPPVASQAQQDQVPADAKARVLPRPPSGDAATIFVERPKADSDLQSHPIDMGQSDGGEDEEQGIDLVALAAGAVLPHPDKAETGGEDAFFVSSHGQGAFGVADGVGGWNLEGVDPSRYSRLLMEHAEQAILQGFGDNEDGAREVVGVAHETITWQGEQEGAVILGSSTICLGLLRPGGLLEMANVGDSGFRVVRGKETVFASEAQQHQFNMPFQLAVPGPEQYTDTCESAVVYELELEPGDVVILATDGVLDNLWDEQLAQLVHRCLGVSSPSIGKV
ncbi:hypothetical protein ABBQ32_002017 [Trebouxia sp. C0010 RCD-2024]